MDNDPQTTTGCKEEAEEERQNRRQFFNGLGKWSLAIIAAVVGLREGVQDPSRFGTGPEAAGDPRKQIAKKTHVDQAPQPHMRPPSAPCISLQRTFQRPGMQRRRADDVTP